jgi:hypothetical protein
MGPHWLPQPPQAFEGQAPYRQARARSEGVFRRSNMVSVESVAVVRDEHWRLIDVADYLGVTKQRAHQLADEAAFPEPDGEDLRGRYWRPVVVRSWARRWVKQRPWRRLTE